MAITVVASIISNFEAGDKPSGADFEELINHAIPGWFEQVAILVDAGTPGVFEIESTASATPWGPWSSIAVDAVATSAASVGAGATDSIALGDGASVAASVLRAVALGKGATVSATEGVVIGDTTSIGTTSNRAVAIGNAANIGTNSTGSIAIGDNATIGNDNAAAIAIGDGALISADTDGSVVIGQGSQATSDVAGRRFQTVIGPFAAGNGFGAVAIGNGADANGSGVVGDDGAIAIGEFSTADGNFAIAIGETANAGLGAGNEAHAIAIGAETDSFFAHGVAIGAFAETNDEGDFAFNGQGSITYQGHTLLPWLSTSDATPTALNMGPTTNPGFNVETEAAYGFKGIIIARTVGNAHAMWEVKGLIERTSATTTLLFSTVVELHDDTAGVTLACAANDTNDTLEFTATGIAATVIRWSGKIELTEVVH